MASSDLLCFFLLNLFIEEEEEKTKCQCSVFVAHRQNDRTSTAENQDEQFTGAKLSILVVRLNFGENMYSGDEEKRSRAEQHGDAGRIHRVRFLNSLQRRNRDDVGGEERDLRF